MFPHHQSLYFCCALCFFLVKTKNSLLLVLIFRIQSNPRVNSIDHSWPRYRSKQQIIICTQKYIKSVVLSNCCWLLNCCYSPNKTKKKKIFISRFDFISSPSVADLTTASHSGRPRRPSKVSINELTMLMFCTQQTDPPWNVCVGFPRILYNELGFGRRRCWWYGSVSRRTRYKVYTFNIKRSKCKDWSQ